MRVGTFIAVSGPTERVEIHRQVSDLAVHTTHFPRLYSILFGQLGDAQAIYIYGINCNYLKQGIMVFFIRPSGLPQIVYKINNIRRFGLKVSAFRTERKSSFAK